MATTQLERIETLDTVRGVAVMGILLMNIVAFGMPEVAYMNPAAFGGHQGADLGVYLFNFILFDGKMRGLFSFLFGASMLLVIDRAVQKGESPARVHFSRMAWLFVFGVAHLTLLWWGDILNHYAIVGAIAYLFRDLRVKSMVAVGILLIVLQCLLLAMMPLAVVAMQAAASAPDATAAAQARETLLGFDRGFGTPDAVWLQEQLVLHRGSWGGLIKHRLGRLGQSISGGFFIAAETLGYMLLGMAGLRSGMLIGAWPRARYVRWAAIGFGIGIPAYALLARWVVASDFAMVTVVTAVMTLSAPVRPLMILGWTCLAILLARPGGRITARIAAAGRMAFTNYLVASMVMTTLFYGYGFGLFGTLSRVQLYLPVLGMWAAMLLWSKPWLNRFRYGPFEWLWRSLARLRMQPIWGAAVRV